MTPKQVLQVMLDKEALMSCWEARVATRAQMLYDGYCNHTGWKSAVTGASLPQWEDVSEPVKEAWLATALAIDSTPGWPE